MPIVKFCLVGGASEPPPDINMDAVPQEGDLVQLEDKTEWIVTRIRHELHGNESKIVADIKPEE